MDLSGKRKRRRGRAEDAAGITVDEMGMQPTTAGSEASSVAHVPQPLLPGTAEAP